MTSAAGKLKLTYAMFKPTTSVCPKTCTEITERILGSKFYVVRQKRMQMTEKIAKEFYAEHVGKPFFNGLMSYMTSGPIVAHILAKEDAVPAWRNLMGPTKVSQGIFSNPDCLRALYGLTDSRNATHGADANKSADREIKIIFPEFNTDEWMGNEEQHFRKGRVEFDDDKKVHLPV